MFIVCTNCMDYFILMNGFHFHAFKEILVVQKASQADERGQAAIKVNNGFQEKSIDRIERPSMDIGLLTIKGCIEKAAKPYSNSVSYLI